MQQKYTEWGANELFNFLAHTENLSDVATKLHSLAIDGLNAAELARTPSLLKSKIGLAESQCTAFQEAIRKLQNLSMPLNDTTTYQTLRFVWSACNEHRLEQPSPAAFIEIWRQNYEQIFCLCWYSDDINDEASDVTCNEWDNDLNGANKSKATREVEMTSNMAHVIHNMDEISCLGCAEISDEPKFLLCDNVEEKCQNGAHIYCLDPPLSEVPPSEQKWFCPSCTGTKCLSTLLFSNLHNFCKFFISQKKKKFVKIGLSVIRNRCMYCQSQIYSGSYQIVQCVQDKCPQICHIECLIQIGFLEKPTQDKPLKRNSVAWKCPICYVQHFEIK
ncbi:jumonji/arid domain-containing protein [Reticulomyxa filosa]|uniref:Jumonji/arid domain-containing protein n=1 Tax=Reticulomyxa filosa TaxID=46433 RepID=X6P483_RETFI|nr:jumonji/arid domain-containing protein [Reticulomyxa filosa]|eukprot:ETO32928.1 jumonji/arid domain-containing protein [Reticulomyxa filosa]